MQQRLEFSLKLSGEGRDFELSNAYLIAHARRNNQWYGSAHLIAIVTIKTTEYVNSDALRLKSTTMTVDTGYECKLPVCYYVVNDSGYPVGYNNYAFIEVGTLEEIGAIRDLVPLAKNSPNDDHELFDSPKKINQLLNGRNVDNQRPTTTHEGVSASNETDFEKHFFPDRPSHIKKEFGQEKPVCLTQFDRPPKSPLIDSKIELAEQDDDYSNERCTLF